MSKQTNLTKTDDKLDLDKLYLNRKHQLRMPRSSKHVLLQHARETRISNGWFNRLSFYALAASTMLLVMFVSFTPNQSPLNNAHLVTNVELHSMPVDNIKPSISAELTQRRAQHYADYIAKEQTLKAYRQSFAKIMSTNNGLELKTCDNTRLYLSQTLVNALANMNKLDSNVKKGQQVAIVFDKQGIILSILEPKQGPMC
ncbi:hypothetical protein OE749_13585 [Aestuariibacter sp. AA17]|uniref:Uncharacterized protein n=1 Tax=Fluctibacter corallii TaxID=2984329 RepID=A0ABT3AAW1_9ALTE|nr:hypothetical protein [Aestuariibacter sp. AA17]MCV2885725.1 hypothetical protein [Aestuariibacter sp. AA17]